MIFGLRDELIMTLVNLIGWWNNKMCLRTMHTAAVSTNSNGFLLWER